MLSENRTAARPRDGEAIARLRRTARADTKTGCLIWQGAKTDSGYGRVRYKGKDWRTHRLAYAAWRGPIPEEHYVCHRCDNRLCMAIAHLFLGTQQDNIDDMWRKGRGRCGSKLCEADVVDIKTRLARGERVTDLAAKYGVRYGTVLAIRSGRNWAHVDPTGTGPEGSLRRGSSRIPILQFRAADE